MKIIEIEDDLYKYILANIEAFGETPSQILRRLLSIPSVLSGKQQIDLVHGNIEAPVSASKMAITTLDEPIFSASNTLLPEAFAHGIKALFAHELFKNEVIITNKFKMMLTTMYYENKEAFIEAANVAKGRSRDYLGQNLEALLASENEDELALLIASKPREIPFTPFWVVTNANTGRKRIILTQMMASMGYPQHLIECIQDEI